MNALPDGERRCAQPPYDKLPIPRADIPEGVILSRGATHFLREDEIPVVTFTDAHEKSLVVKVMNYEGITKETAVTGQAIAFTLYQGRMIWQYDYAYSAWMGGSSTNWASTSWEDSSKLIDGMYLMGYKSKNLFRLAFRDVQNATNQRTFIGCLIPNYPCGNTVPYLTGSPRTLLGLIRCMNSYAVDRPLRIKMSQNHVNWFYAAELPIAQSTTEIDGCETVAHMAAPGVTMSPQWILFKSIGYSRLSWRKNWHITQHDRIRCRCIIDATSSAIYGLDSGDLSYLLRDSDWDLQNISNKRFTGTLDPKGFWRIDKTKHPELRSTVLSLVAFHDLQNHITACGGDVAQGIEAFCKQNDGEGWMLPETLRLADYGLGHDERAREHQPVRSCFGPRYYDWQLAQSAEESWSECRLHARNLLGAVGYRALLDELEGKAQPIPIAPTSTTGSKKNDDRAQGKRVDNEHMPLFDP